MPLLKNLKQKLIYILVFLIISGTIASAYYYYDRYSQASKQLTALKSQAPNSPPDENAKIIAAVTKLVELPQTPPDGIGQITDKNQYKNLVFYNEIVNGDYLLIYVQANKAVIYRPSTNKLVNIYPVSVSNTADSGNANVTGAVMGASVGVVNSSASASQ
jgi:hypothetical protein